MLSRGVVRASSQALRRSRSFSSDPLSRYALGGSRWTRLDASSYDQLIDRAVHEGVTCLEAGQEGGDAALAQALTPILAKGGCPDRDKPIVAVARIGYRSIIKEKGEETDDKAASPLLPGDVVVEKSKSKGLTVAHNLDPEHLVEVIAQSPLVKLNREIQDPTLFRVMLMIHNPESQVLPFLAEHGDEVSVEERQRYIQAKLLRALPAMEVSADEKLFHEYGITSNGLGLPPDHPLHLSPSVILAANKSEISSSKFSTVQLPANLLETAGWQVGREIREQSIEDGKPINMWAMRPLTCYPDLGTGTGYPFGLVDYEIPGSDLLDGENENDGIVDLPPKKKFQFTNEMSGPPAIYQVALQTAISHFDGQELLEIKRERDLTTEERETLDGCKLCQSMLHDLDAGLENVRSFYAYEEELHSRVIPLLYDTFEEFDERTGDVLQAFFAAHAVAVRYSIAKRTRTLLKEGGDTSADDKDTGRGGCTTKGDKKQDLVKEDDDDDATEKDGSKDDKRNPSQSPPSSLRTFQSTKIFRTICCCRSLPCASYSTTMMLHFQRL